MEQRFHCTTCPSECELTVLMDEDGKVLSVSGNRCPRGEAFAQQETVRPVRVLTSTAKLTGAGENCLLPLRSAQAFPLDLHQQAMEEIRQLCVKAPVRMGDVLLPQVAGWDTPIVAACDADSA